MVKNIINSGINYLMDKSGVQQHLDENEILRAAADNNQISNELYNKMGGFNFKENVPYAGNVGTGIGSAAYNIVQSIRDGQPISEIFGDVSRNYMGAAAGLTKEEKDIYDNILGRREPTLTDSLVNIPSNLKNMIGDAVFTKAYAPEPTERERQSIEMGIRNPELLNKFDRSPASSGVRQTIGSRITEGLGSIRDTVTDKFGSGLDFLKNLSPIQNIINTVKRGDLSTRGIAGLNANDVFNIDMFGTEEDPTKDRYGYNIVSAFGDYDKFVKDKARELAKMQFRTKSGKERQRFFQDAADAIREKERQRDLEEKRRLTARLSTVGGDSGSDYSNAPGRASAAAQEQSNRDAARGRF